MDMNKDVLDLEYIEEEGEDHLTQREVLLLGVELESTEYETDSSA